MNFICLKIIQTTSHKYNRDRIIVIIFFVQPLVIGLLLNPHQKWKLLLLQLS